MVDNDLPHSNLSPFSYTSRSSYVFLSLQKVCLGTGVPVESAGGLAGGSRLFAMQAAGSGPLKG